MVFTILGTSGSGKGFICDFLHYTYPEMFYSIAVGDLIRAEIRSGSEIGKKWKKNFTAGKLLDDKEVDNLVYAVVRKQLSNGKIIIFDGYPRSLQQAQDLEKLVHVDYCFYLKTSYGTMKRRLLGRRICNQCGLVTNTTNDTKAEYGMCRKCHGVLTVREDDELPSIKMKYKLFKSAKKEVLSFYKDRIVKINANKNEDECVRDFINAIKPLISKKS